MLISIATTWLVSDWLYARASTQEQNLDLQLKALEQAGCEKIFKDKGISGMQRDRPQRETPGGKLVDGAEGIVVGASGPKECPSGTMHMSIWRW